jgi:hypothetical protein
MARIDDYSFGSMTVDGARYTDDVRIVGGRARGDWWRASGHVCAAADVADILEAGPEVLVLGLGSSSGMRVAADLEQACEARGIELVAQPTKQAAATYNDLADRGRDVAAGFHLTC